MKSTHPLHECTACKGTGKVELSKPLHDALKTIPPKGKRSVIDAALRLAITEQAMNARLVTLQKLGFVERTKAGKKYLYSRK